MRLTFLAAGDRTPLTKRFTRVDSGYDKTAYPMVREVTSLALDVTNIKEFSQAVTECGNENMCLLRGNLSHPVSNASRAGLTNPTESTQWLALDFDYHTPFPLDDALAAVDPALLETQRIVRQSSSSGITSPYGSRYHVFCFLDEPVPFPQLKAWMVSRNLEAPFFKARLQLTASAMALRYALDPSVSQADKLLFIAPPICTNFQDPIKHRQEVLGGAPALDTSSIRAATPKRNAEGIREHIEALRKKEGLRKRQIKLERHELGEICTNPEPCKVTDEKAERGFVYLNLNGGNSWGYYYPEGSPGLLYNFKGEPLYRLSDICPAYARELKVRELPQPEVGENKYIALIERRSDAIYRGWYNVEANDWDMDRSNRANALDFLAGSGQPKPDHLEIWDIGFDPRDLVRVKPEQRWLNRFEPTPYMFTKGVPGAEIPRTINWIIDHVLGGDAAAVDHFQHWLAWIFQNRNKSKTAWIFQGTEGTGKGTMFHEILRPLFGSRQAAQVNQNAFLEQFNSFVESNLILWVDEVELQECRQSDRVTALWRQLITEPVMMMRYMRENLVEQPNFSNMLISTNRLDSVSIGINSRRYNVGAVQNERIYVTDAHRAAIARELEAFAQYLAGKEVDHDKVFIALENDAKRNLAMASFSSTDRFFTAINEGDLNFFVDFLTDDPIRAAEPHYTAFRSALLRWAEEAPNGEMTITRDELSSVYAYLQGQYVSVNKFTRMCNSHRVSITPCRLPDGRSVRGVRVKWHYDEGALNHVKTHTPTHVGKVTAIR